MVKIIFKLHGNILFLEIIFDGKKIMMIKDMIHNYLVYIVTLGTKHEILKLIE